MVAIVEQTRHHNSLGMRFVHIVHLHANLHIVAFEYHGGMVKLVLGKVAYVPRWESFLTFVADSPLNLLWRFVEVSHRFEFTWLTVIEARFLITVLVAPVVQPAESIHIIAVAILVETVVLGVATLSLAESIQFVRDGLAGLQH